MDLKKHKIYFNNTLSGEIETFIPNRRKKVGMYHCGPTVYNKAHVGNLCAYIFADVLRRLFEEQGYEVNQVINITDVGHLTNDRDDGDDKIESESKKTGETAVSIAQKYTDLFFQDLRNLNIEVDKITFPKATDHITEQIELIQTIEKNGFTYKISDGIYFDTKKFEDYGKLGGIDLEGLQAGARVELNAEKRNPTDFALWKFSKTDKKRQQEWNSPWGVGFPGWHIECSAMSKKYLGMNFDIHTGGIDHVATHHNNEIAQSQAADGQLLANYWMHVNHIMLNGQKISKSIGNVVTIDEFAQKNIPPAVFRYWYLTSHYGTSANFTWETITSTQKAFDKIVNLISETKQSKKINKKYYKKALKELNHDVGTPEAIAVIWEIINDNSLEKDEKVSTILKIDNILGIGFALESKKIQDKPENIPNEVIKLAEQRKTARLNKDFDTADSLRSKINELGFGIKDIGENYAIKAK